MAQPGDTTVDAIVAGRLFPFSRAFAQAGFDRADAEAWRRAGWHEPEEAARWRTLGGDATPRQLRALRQAGVEPELVARVAAFAPRHTAAWTRAIGAGDDRPAEIDIREPGASDAARRGRGARRSRIDDRERDLRAEVLANLHRDALDRNDDAPRVARA